MGPIGVSSESLDGASDGSDPTGSGSPASFIETSDAVEPAGSGSRYSGGGVLPVAGSLELQASDASPEAIRHQAAAPPRIGRNDEQRMVVAHDTG
jgi:hypothetical protein